MLDKLLLARIPLSSSSTSPSSTTNRDFFVLVSTPPLPPPPFWWGAKWKEGLNKVGFFWCKHSFLQGQGGGGGGGGGVHYNCMQRVARDVLHWRKRLRKGGRTKNYHNGCKKKLLMITPRGNTEWWEKNYEDALSKDSWDSKVFFAYICTVGKDWLMSRGKIRQQRHPFLLISKPTFIHSSKKIY